MVNRLLVSFVFGVLFLSGLGVGAAGGDAAASAKPVLTFAAVADIQYADKKTVCYGMRLKRRHC